MAITVSGPYIKFESGSVAQSDFYDEVFGSGVFSENGSILTIPNGTRFDNINDKIGLRGQEKTNARATITAPESGSVTVASIVSTVYVFAIGGGGGGNGLNSSSTDVLGENGTSSFFSTVIGGGGVGGGAGGTATGGTTNIAGSSQSGGDGGNAGGFGTYLESGQGGGRGDPFSSTPGFSGSLYGGGGGGGATRQRTGPTIAISVIANGGGGGGLAIHPAFPVVGGSTYSYQAGAGGFGGFSTILGGDGVDGFLILEFFA